MTATATSGTAIAPDLSTGEEQRRTTVRARSVHTWTISTTSGYTATGYLPSWAENDPSDANLPLKLLTTRIADISHRRFFEGKKMLVVAPDAKGVAEEEHVLRGSIDCNPYADDPRARVPVFNIQLYPDYWLLGLDPEQVGEVAAQLRAQAELFDDTVRPALIDARDDWQKNHTQFVGH
ncbi:hypothetical protein OG552_15425 [Streptomyces sp. NBC_01476]|uniref:DUF6907 domain-containing protein n=1 Tax=Streptomyces sp. NBC_01476 TaxID=2903881 RepID=UPI002E307744|nr:hypothetical protein [Streptomyces sp. NBC_01476]